MHRKTVFFFSLLIFIVHLNLSYAQGYSPKVGEILQYKVIVKSVIYGANQTIRISSKEFYNGHQVIKVQYNMTTVGVVEKLYKYSETEEVLLDADDYYPLYLKRKVTGKSDLEMEEVHFDYAKGVATRLYIENNAQPERTEIKLPGYVYDGLALQYFLRKGYLAKPFNKLYFYSNGKIKDVRYHVKKTTKQLVLDCGTYANPVQVVSDDIMITTANDQEHYPLIICKMAKFGKVEARLVSISK